jgi:hypothetical protein
MANLTRQEAEVRALALARRLEESFGVKWEAIVHENMGWHYNARYGFLKVYEDCGKYTAMLGSHGGLAMWSDRTYHDTPEKAVIGQLNRALSKLHDLTDILVSSCPFPRSDK